MTASEPVTIAPTMGTKLPRKTATAIGRASGSCRMSAPSPMPTASTNATKICTFANSVTVRHPALAAPSTASRAVRGKSPTTNIQMRRPSRRKNSSAKRASTAPVRISAVVDPIESAPFTNQSSVRSNWPKSSSMDARISVCDSPKVVEAHSSSSSKRSIERSCRSPRPERIWLTTSQTSAVMTPRRVSRPIVAARPFGTRRRRIQLTNGPSSAASSTPTNSGMTSRLSCMTRKMTIAMTPASASRRHA
jgi:hypothetical protein